MEERSRRGRRSKKQALLLYFGAMIVILTVIGILDQLGYVLINSGVQYLLSGLLFCSALALCGVWLVGKIYRKWLRIVVGVADGLLVLGLAVLLVMLFRVNMMLTPNYYTLLESPEGEAVVVMRQISIDKDKIQARIGQADLSDQALENLGYSYSAYPCWGALFYNRNAGSEGNLEIGWNSSAQLMHEWTDSNHLYMYVESPEPGDGGELRLSLE